jgi:hypothetical protein
MRCADSRFCTTTPREGLQPRQYVRECPFPDIRQIKNPRRVEVCAHTRRILGKHSPPHENQPDRRGQVGHGGASRSLDAVSDAATPADAKQTTPPFVK